MANKKISDLTLRSDLDTTCNFPVEDATQTYRITGAQLETFIKARRLTVTTASATAAYTILSTDDIVQSTNTANVDWTLPSAASNTGKILTLRKLGTNAAYIRIVSAIGGISNRQLAAEHDWLQIQSDGANWKVVNGKTTTTFFHHTGNGYGSSSTEVRRYTTQATAIGSGVTYADSASTGAAWTVVEPGVYALSRSEYITGSATGSLGFSLNASAGSAITGLAVAQRLHVSEYNASDSMGLSCTARLAAGDIIRCQDNHGGTPSTTDNSFFRMIKVSE